jgi:predicted Zn-dependent peptidase
VAPRSSRVLARSFAPLLALALAASCGGRSTAPRRSAGPTAEVLAASDLPAPQAAPLPGDPMGVTIHRLSNGLTVYVSTDRAQPRFSAWIAVRAGSRMDPAASTGLAHYLEHMLFKGSSRLGTIDFAREQPHIARVAELYGALRGATDEAQRAALFKQIDAETQEQARYAIPNELDQIYASLGITGVNAFTSDEQTVYITDVPKNRLAAWATVEASRFSDPQFRLFLPELESVYEEKNISLDSPENRMFEALGLALFPEHPYGTQPTIGTVEHLKTPAYADMVAFFQRWYRPNNMAIVLAGDIDAATALPVLERAFGGLEPRALARPEPAALPPIAATKRVDVVAPGEESVFLGWLTVPRGHADEAPLEVLDLLLDNSVSGLLNVDLVLTQKVPKASSFQSFENEAGYAVLSATAREGQKHELLEQLLLAELDKVKRGAFSDEDLAAVVLNAEIAEKRELESNDARVSRMTDAFVGHLPWTYAAGHLDRLRKVSRADVMRVANEYLGANHVVVRRVRGAYQPPKITKPSITPVALDPSRRSPLAVEVSAMAAEPIEPGWLVEGTDYQRATLPGGGFIAVKNPLNDLFVVTYRFDLGERREKLLCHALALLERSGAGEMPADVLVRKLYAMGTSIDTDCTPDETTLTISGIDRNLESAVALLDQWLRTPRFDRATIDALVANTLSQRKDRIAEPRAIAAALAEYAQHGDRSSFLTAPSNAALRAASGATLRALLAGLPDRQHRTTYFGPRAAADAARVVALGHDHTRVAPIEKERFRTLPGGKHEVYLLSQPTAQSMIRIAMPKPPSSAADRAIGTLYTEYMSGGMGALVFQEIREARGLAYSAFAAYGAGERVGDQAELLAGLGTQGDKTTDALTTMLGLLGKPPITAARLATAKRSIEEGYRTTRIEPRAVAGVFQAWVDLGEPDDPRPRTRRAIDQADAATLAAFSERAASGGTIISVAGDASRFDLATLATLGTVIKVKVEQLFSY